MVRSRAMMRKRTASAVLFLLAWGILRGFMKHDPLIPVAALFPASVMAALGLLLQLASAPVLGQTQAGAPGATYPGAIYRCGNDFLNDAAVALARGCTAVEVSQVTVPGTRVHSLPDKASISGSVSGPTSASISASLSAPVHSMPAAAAPLRMPTGRVDSNTQRERDSDALSILQAELARAEALLAERQRDFSGASATPTPASAADAQRHALRLTELQNGMGRHLSDIASLKREISRLPRASALR